MDEVVELLKKGAIPAITSIESIPGDNYQIEYPVINDEKERFNAIIRRLGGGMHFFIPPFVAMDAVPAEVFLTCNGQVPFAHFFLVSSEEEQKIAIESIIPPPFAADVDMCVEAIRCSLELHYRFHVGIVSSQILMGASISGNKKLTESAMEEIAALQARMASLVGKAQEGI